MLVYHINVFYKINVYEHVLKNASILMRFFKFSCKKHI